MLLEGVNEVAVKLITKIFFLLKPNKKIRNRVKPTFEHFLGGLACFFCAIVYYLM